jgi:hypothetical protein
MPLLNYTTKISADTSVAEISRSLAKVGARRVMYEYDNQGNIIALSFEILLQDSPIAFKLPTDWRPVLEVMQKDKKIPRRLATQDQALRVAWRITKDWVEAQVAYIETMIVTTAQVFLPYAVTRDGKSMYEYVATNSHILTGGDSDEVKKL